MNKESVLNTFNISRNEHKIKSESKLYDIAVNFEAEDRSAMIVRRLLVPHSPYNNISCSSVSL